MLTISTLCQWHIPRVQAWPGEGAKLPARVEEAARTRDALDYNLPRLRGEGGLGVVATEVVHPGRSWKVVAATHATPARSRRMDVHQNAKNTPRGRRSMIQRLAEGWTILAVAAAFDVDPKTVRKWRARFLAEGEAGLADRSSRPHRSPTRLGEAAQGEILALRRQRLSGPAIARRLGRPVATVGLVLRRRGLGRLGALDPKPADRPLPARAARRADPHRHQEARPDRRRRPPHHRRPDPPGARHRLGLPACLRRRRLAPRLHRDPARRAPGECRRLP